MGDDFAQAGVGSGDDFGHLMNALPAGSKVAVVSNAVDFIPHDDRVAYARNVFDPVEHFRSFGLEAFDLDLRKYFDRSNELEADVAKVQLIWANGGNAFMLRRAMAQSGLDRILRERVTAGTLIYGGWSAGSVVAGPTPSQSGRESGWSISASSPISNQTTQKPKRPHARSHG